jgi:uncharacterized protein (TIGR03083 family)
VALPSPTYLAHLEQAAADVAAMLETGDLDAPVPACPPWRVTDLVHHLGGVHRWARVAVVESSAQRPDTGDAPTERDALVAWFSEGVDALVATLRETDPGTPCWTFGPPPTAAFWFRRQAHETSMHAWDAEQAASGTGSPFPLELSLDGVDEVVTILVPRQIRLGRLPAFTRVVALFASDAPGGPAWRLGPAGREPDGAVSAPAATLLLLLWRRETLDGPDVVVSGEQDAVRAVMTAPFTP